MINLESLSRPKLLEKARALEIPDISDSTSKSVLLQKLQSLLESIPSLFDEVEVLIVTNPPIVKRSLTSEERIWKSYLDKFKITPEQFLKRYPNHAFKSIIEKLK